MSHLSRGQQQKVAVARAFLTSPVLMLLDEPTTGLDPRSKRDVQAFVRQVQRDHDASILLTTHDMEEAELLCDRIAFISGGRIVAEGTPLELRQSVANGRPVEDIDMEDVFMELTGRGIEEDESPKRYGWRVAIPQIAQIARRKHDGEWRFGSEGEMTWLASRNNAISGAAGRPALILAFIERQTNLWKRYWAWELVWLVYGVVNTLAVTLIANQVDSPARQRAPTCRGSCCSC